MSVNPINYPKEISYHQNSQEKAVQLYSKFDYNPDWCSFSALKKIPKDDIEILFNKVMAQQGFVGKTCDKIKNKFHFKNSSDNVKKVIEEYKSGLVSSEDAKKAVDSYITSHKKVLDFFADWGSAVAGVLTFSVLSATAPIPALAAMMFAGAGGSAFKVLFKKTDSKSANRNYNTYGYDMITGFINGMLSPLVNGISNTATKHLAKKFGVKAIAKPVKTVLDVSDNTIIDKLLIAPKLKLEGKLLKKLPVLAASNIARILSKLGLSTIMREIAFKLEASKLNSMNYKTAVFKKSFFTNEEIELLNKKYEQTHKSITNDVYNTEEK